MKRPPVSVGSFCAIRIEVDTGRGSLQAADARTSLGERSAAGTVSVVGPRASIASFTSASASSFCSRGTERTVQRSNPRRAGQRLRVEGLQVRLLDPVLAGDLARHELRVVDDLDLARAELRAPARGPAAARGTRPRCWSPRRCKSLARASSLPVRRPSTTDADAGGPGVAARAAVHVDDDAVGRGSARGANASMLGNMPGRRRRRSRISRLPPPVRAALAALAPCAGRRSPRRRARPCSSRRACRRARSASGSGITQ